MSSGEPFPWRPAPAEDWAERCKALDGLVRATPAEGASLDDAGVELRRLAGMRLGPREQLKMENLARRFVATGLVPAHFRRLRIGLLAARTLSFMTGPIAAAGPARGLLVETLEAPYDQIGAFAYGPFNPFAGQTLDAVVVVLDEATFPGDAPLLDSAAEDRRLDAAEGLLQALGQAVRAKAGCPVIIATLPPASPRIASADLATPGDPGRFEAEVNRIIVRGGARRDWIVWDLAGLAGRIGRDRWLDPVRFHLAKAPFGLEHAPLAADSLCALLAAMVGKAGRALVLDLDNTVWGGVIGDDGLDGIRLGQNSAEGEAFIAFQHYALALRARGVVLAVCSKNTDAVAREPFRSHPDMLLREDHIAVFQANWNDKATNLTAVAETLNLGLESLVFVDDNPAERARVRQSLPLVAVPEVGDDPAWFIARIADSGVFEHLPLNSDDTARADAYGARARQAEVRAQIGDYDAYLASLDMRMTISPFDDVGRARIAQLIAKSNQFNLTTRRYNEEDVRRMQDDPDLLCWQVRLDDAFAAQGMICVVIVRKGPIEWAIDSWLQSCRILERGVEETVMNHLVAAARAAGAQRITGEYLPTPRNALVADFYDRMGFAPVGEATAERRAYVCDVATDPVRKSFITVTLTSG